VIPFRDRFSAQAGGLARLEMICCEYGGLLKKNCNDRGLLRCLGGSARL